MLVRHPIKKLLALCFCLCAGMAVAATCTSKASGNWDSSGTWSCTSGSTPAIGDSVVLVSPFAVSLNGNNRTAASLTINAGATLNDDGQDLTITGGVINNGTFGTNGGALIMRGANSTLSGSGVFNDTDVQADASGISIPAGSTMAFENGAQLRVGRANAGRFTLNGTMVGTGLASGDRIIRVYDGSNATINGTVNAPGAYIRIEQNATLTNNGSVTVQYLDSDGNNASAVWTQGNGATLTLSQTPAGDWQGTLNASATNNTVTFTGTAVAFSPQTYYNINVPAAQCPHPAGITVLGTSSCNVSPAPVAEYRMDEPSWNGIAGEVVDSAGNYPGSAKNNANTVDVSRAIPGNPGTCRYGQFDSGSAITKGYVELPNFPDLTTNFTVTAWIRTTDNSKQGQRVFIDDEKNTKGYGISLGDGGPGKLRFYARGSKTIILDTPNVITNNTWYFVAGVADITNGIRKIYVYDAIGNLLPGLPVSVASKGWGTDVGMASIGGETNSSGESPTNFHFRGNIDEVQIFSASLNQAALTTLAKQTHPCTDNTLHHLEIQSSGTGLTCAASTATVRACADAACTTLYTGGVSGTLAATGTPTVNWDGTTGGASGAGFVIAAGSSSVTKNLQPASTGSVLLGITSASPAPTNATSCNFGTPSCTFVANSAGFIFSNTTTGSAYTLPAQVSGLGSANLYLRAVQSSTTNPAVCTPAIVGQSTAVDLGYSCNNPASCQPGNLATVNTTAIAPGGTPVTLVFDGNGSAPVTLRYDDVGQITFNASKTVTPFGGSTPVNLIGSSNAFVVAPHHFGFSSVTTGLIKAGTPFSATVTAYSGLATPTATANFGKESTPESVAVSFARYQPTGTGAVNGSFSGGVGAFNAGAASATNLVWSEVGSIDLTAVLASGSYLGSGLTASGSTGSTGAVGPFIPDHFDVVVSQACVAGGFTYSGQAVTATITAMNGATPPAKTLNYDGSAATSPNFAKTLTLSDANGLALGAFTPSTLAPSAFTAGVAGPAITYTFSNPLTAPQTIALRAVDVDAVSSSGFAEGTLAVRTGRLRLQNAFGSDRLPLSIPVQAQYWDGSYFVPNSADSCTTLTVPAAQTLTAGASPNGVAALYFYPVVTGKNQLQSSDTTASLASPLAAGKTQLTFTAPLHAGWLDLILQVPDYLRGNWGNCSGQTGAAGLYDDLPCARATFGVFKSPLIYRRENY